MLSLFEGLLLMLRSFSLRVRLRTFGLKDPGVPPQATVALVPGRPQGRAPGVDPADPPSLPALPFAFNLLDHWYAQTYTVVFLTGELSASPCTNIIAVFAQYM